MPQTKFSTRLLATVCVALNAVGATQAAAPADRDTAMAVRLDAIIERALAEGRIVGTVVMVARHGQPVYRRAAGLADREAGAPMREDTVFRLASLTKAVVSVAGMRLVDEGRLTLEDRVDRWLPWFQPRLPDGTIADLRVRHLFEHTSGLSYGFFEPDGSYARAGVGDGLDDTGLTLEENLRRLATVPLKFEPGTGWQYSMATDVLGAVLEAAGGAPLPELIRDLVTGPAGMVDTGFFPAAQRLAAVYVNAEPEARRLEGPSSFSLLGGEIRANPDRALNPDAYASGGGGMSGTAADILALLEVIRNGGADLLRPDTVRSMMVDRIAHLPQAPAPGWGFGLGWALFVDPALDPTPQSPGTISWSGVYGHTWFIDPAEGLSAVVLTNTTPEGMVGAYPFAIRDAVYR